jgi:hypothetical protein
MDAASVGAAGCVVGQRTQNHEREVALELGQAARQLREVIRGPEPVGEQRRQRDTEAVRELRERSDRGEDGPALDSTNRLARDGRRFRELSWVSPLRPRSWRMRRPSCVRVMVTSPRVCSGWMSSSDREVGSVRSWRSWASHSPCGCEVGGW